MAKTGILIARVDVYLKSYLIKRIGVYFLTSVVLNAIIAFNLIAQDETNHNYTQHILKVIPPSPNASSLGKYGDIPVGHFTGVPQINVPFHTIEGKSLKLPIELNYHAGGIKVNEIASWVGLGWSLNAGGVITRMVVGEPDEQSNGHLSYNTFAAALPLPINYELSASQYQVYESIAYGLYDTEPDIFTFNIMGRSGKFFIDANKSVHMLSHSDLKIEFSSNLTEWKITDEAGTIYNFNVPEYTTTNNSSNSSVTSWYINKISSVRGEEINFEYEKSLQANLSAINFSEVEYYMNPELAANHLGRFGDECTSPGGGVTYTAYNTSTVRLLSIETELVKVKFNKSSIQRQDPGGDYALDNIQVFLKQGNKLSKTLKFNYGYFDSGNSCSAIGYGHEHFNWTVSKRLRLDSIEEITADGIDKKKHSFFYNSKLLPALCSYAQDYAGYFNGALNTNLLPKMSDLPQTSINANREPDPEAAQACLLTKIVYPTGGASVFTYGGHLIGTGETTTSTPAVASVNMFNEPAETVQTASMPIGKAQTVYINYNLHYGGYPEGYVRPQVQIINEALPEGDPNRVVFSVSGEGSATNFPVLLSAGSYILKGVSPDVPSYLVDATVAYTAEVVSVVDRYASGIRVESIKDFDADGVRILQEKKFSYSSAKLSNYFSDESFYRVDLTLDHRYEEQCFFPMYEDQDVYSGRASFGNYSAGLLMGSHLSYGKVTEVKGEGNGLIEYEFSQFEEDVDLGMPHIPATMRDWKNGLLTRKKVIDANGFCLLDEIYNYDYIKKNTFTGLKLAFLYDNYCNSASNGGGHIKDQITRKHFYYESGWARLKKKEVTTFYANGAESLKSITNYFYDNPNYIHANRIEFESSKGENIKTISRYALDAITGLSTRAQQAKDSLVNQHRMKELLEQETYVNSALTEKVRINYAVQWPSSFVTMPETIETQVAGSALEPRHVYHDYDDKGNPLTHAKANSALTSYIWDYAGSYPVCEVQNADRSSIAYTSFETDGTGNWSIPSTIRQSNEGLTGTQSYSLVNGNVTKVNLSSGKSYIVAYWSKGGSAIVNNITGTAGLSRNGWTYFEHNLPITTTAVTVSGSNTIDELRLYPLDAQMTTYTYNPLLGMTSTTDANGRTSYYDYDDFGRLRLIRDDAGNIVKTYQYHYHQ